MDCVCSRTCTIRKDGKSIFVEKGQIFDFDKCPPHHFQALHDVTIDFNEVSLELLLMSKEWKTKDALAYLKKEFNFTPKGAITRREIAQAVIDQRMRKVTLPNEV